MATVREIEAYIRQAALARGINPDIAVKVARSEGLAPGVWQSNYHKGGYREPSYGPFQLLVGGKGTGFPTGLGNQFVRQTGLDPRDKSTYRQQVDFALDHAARNGWGAWYGAKKVGVGRWDGLGNASPRGVGASPVDNIALPDVGPALAFAPQSVPSGFDPFSLLISQANAAEPVQPPTLNAPVAEPTPPADLTPPPLTAAMSDVPPPPEANVPQLPMSVIEPQFVERWRNDPARAAAAAAANADAGDAIQKMVEGLEKLAPAPEAPAPAEIVSADEVLPGGDPAQYDTLTIMQNPDLSVAPNIPFVDQSPIPRLPMEELTYLDNGVLSPAAPVLTGNGFDTFGARPMPEPAGPLDMNPTAAIPPAVPQQQLPQGPNIPTPRPRPTPPAATPQFSLTNVLTALGGLMAALDQGSPDLAPVSLPGYAHKPQNTQIPIPRGLL